MCFANINNCHVCTILLGGLAGPVVAVGAFSGAVYASKQASDYYKKQKLCEMEAEELRRKKNEFKEDQAFKESEREKLVATIQDLKKEKGIYITWLLSIVQFVVNVLKLFFGQPCATF